MRAVSIFLSLLFLPSCLGFTSNKMPDWYFNPPKEDSKLYGVGEGYSRDDAKYNALADIASQLRVSVSSYFKSEEHSNLIAFDSRASKIVQTKVAANAFNNYNIEKSTILSDGKIVILTSIDKELFIKEQRERIDSTMKIMNDKYLTLDGKTILEKRAILKDINESAEMVEAKMYLIISIDQTLDVGTINNTLTKYRSELRNVLSDIIFFIQTDDKDIKSSITNVLNNDNIRVVGKMSQNPNLVKLKANVKITEVDVYGSYMTKLTFQFQLETSKGEKINSITLDSAGTSSISFKEAKNVAMKNFTKRVYTEGLKVIGL